VLAAALLLGGAGPAGLDALSAAYPGQFTRDGAELVWSDGARIVFAGSTHGIISPNAAARSPARG